MGSVKNEQNDDKQWDNLLLDESYLSTLPDASDKSNRPEARSIAM